VSFYQLDRQKGDFKLLRTCLPSTLHVGNFRILFCYLLGTLGNRTTNVIRWAPRGRFIVLGTMGSSSKSELEFWDLDFNQDENSRKEAEWGSGIQHLGTADHYAVTDVEWDPSGRYVATSASAWTHTVRHCFYR
jgi:translation initiation factor 3 subunit B